MSDECSFYDLLSSSVISSLIKTVNISKIFTSSYILKIIYKHSLTHTHTPSIHLLLFIIPLLLTSNIINMRINIFVMIGVSTFTGATYAAGEFQ